MHAWLIALGIALLVLGTWMIVLTVHGSFYKTRWEINFGWSGECPTCHNHRRLFRIPRNFRQFLWGGGTCRRCGLEVDKWNRPVGS
jgi:hypothetical protein